MSADLRLENSHRQKPDSPWSTFTVRNSGAGILTQGEELHRPGVDRERFVETLEEGTGHQNRGRREPHYR